MSQTNDYTTGKNEAAALQTLTQVSARVDALANQLESLSRAVAAARTGLCATLWLHRSTVGGLKEWRSRIKRLDYDVGMTDEKLMRELFALDSVMGDDTIRARRRESVLRIKALIAQTEQLRAQCARFQRVWLEAPGWARVQAPAAAAAASASSSSAAAASTMNTDARVASPTASSDASTASPRPVSDEVRPVVTTTTRHPLVDSSTAAPETWQSAPVSPASPLSPSTNIQPVSTAAAAASSMEPAVSRSCASSPRRQQQPKQRRVPHHRHRVSNGATSTPSPVCAPLELTSSMKTAAQRQQQQQQPAAQSTVPAAAAAMETDTAASSSASSVSSAAAADNSRKKKTHSPVASKATAPQDETPVEHPTDAERAQLPRLTLEMRQQNGGNSVVLTAPLPGVARADLSVRIRPHTITVRGVKRPTDDELAYAQLYRALRRGAQPRMGFGWFDETYQVPDSLDTERAQAVFTDGVLTITLPRRRNSPALAPQRQPQQQQQRTRRAWCDEADANTCTRDDSAMMEDDDDDHEREAQPQSQYVDDRDDDDDYADPYLSAPRCRPSSYAHPAALYRQPARRPFALFGDVAPPTMARGGWPMMMNSPLSWW